MYRKNSYVQSILRGLILLFAVASSVYAASPKAGQSGPIRIKGFDSSRSSFYGNPSITTGACLSVFRSLLLDPANFGADGIVTRTVTLDTLSAITTYSLESTDIFVFFQGQNLQSTETLLIESFVQRGGGLLYFTTNFMPSLFNTTWGGGGSSRYGYRSTEGASSPIIAGPFGTVGQIFLGANQSATNNGQGFDVAENSAGPIILSFSADHGFSGLGRAVLVGDEEVFLNGDVQNAYSGQINLSTNNQKLLLNTIAFLAGAPGFQGPATPLIQIITPAGGETLAGNTYTSVSWQSDVVYAGTSVRFELWQDDHWLLDLGRDSSSTGQRTSVIYLPLVPEAENYHFRAVSAYNSAIWADSSPFSITGGAVRLHSPNGGEHWNSNSIQPITWSIGTATAGTSVRFELWKAARKVADLGSGWNPLGSGVSWITVPPVLSGSDYRIRLISTWAPELWDESDATFTILGLSISAVSHDGWASYE